MTIISHTHKFIFLKSRKTAGTSVSVPFARVCGSEDVLALSQDVTDNFRIERQNNRRSILSMSAYSLARHCYFLARNTGRWKTMDTLMPTYQQHMTVSELKEAVGEEVWKSYYKFTIERNPYDRLVSFYNWRKNRFNLSVSFEDFAWAVFDRDKKYKGSTYGFSNRPFYLDNKNNLQVDKVILFEELQEGMAEVFESLGFDGFSIGNIPSLKSGVREGRGYRSLYSKKLIERAKKEFSIEEKLFRYKF